MSTGGALESVEDDLSLLDNEDIENVEDIESTLDPEETSNQIMPDVGASNLDEVLEKRRAWRDYQGSPDYSVRQLSKSFGLLGGLSVGADIFAGSNTAPLGVFFGGCSLAFYLEQKRSEYKHSASKEVLEDINDKLEDCYVLPADYDLSNVREDDVQESIKPYEDVLRHFEGLSEAEEMAESELKDNYPEEDWEDEWSDFTDSEQYSEGMQVIWLDEQDNVHGETEVVEWKIEFYKENGEEYGEEYEVVHESYGSTSDIEEVEEIKGDGEKSLEMTRKLEEMFDTPSPKYRVRKPV